MGYTKGSDLIRCLEGLLAKTQSPNTVRIDANIKQCREHTTKCTCLSVLTDHVYDHRHCSVLCHRQRKSGRRLNHMFISSSPLSCYSLSSSLSPIHSYNSLIPASLLSSCPASSVLSLRTHSCSALSSCSSFSAIFLLLLLSFALAPISSWK